MNYIDIHTHHAEASDNCIEVVNFFPSDDLPESKHPHEFFSMGLHPWYLEHKNIEKHWELLKQKVSLSKFVAVGEAGLDKVSKINWSVQCTWFEKQIELSEEVKKPLIVHCVKAYSDILSFKKKFIAKQPWIIHGFNGGLQLANDLIEHECYLSVGEMLLRSNSKISKSIDKLPLQKLFFETDDNREISIQHVYELASEKMNLPLSEITRTLSDNFQNVFSGINNSIAV